MRIVLYGLPCAGKSTILSKLSNVRIVNGSEELNKMCNGVFETLSESEKTKLRKEYIKNLTELPDKLVISDGHYSFLDNVVFTEEDAQAYDVFIYMFCSAEMLLKRYANSDKNNKYANLTLAQIDKWQFNELERLRFECHKNNKDFYIVCSENVTSTDLTTFINYIVKGYSTFNLAKDIATKIMNTYPIPCEISLVDGDKTIISQDSFKICSNGYKTTVFDGNFYTGYQSLQFSIEANSVKYDLSLLSQINLNDRVFSRIKDQKYFVISAGITKLWDELSKKFNLQNVIATPLISADTKYFITKILKEAHYTVIAYGDSKNDIYMLNHADIGYLYIGKKLSKSLVCANTANLRLIYDKSTIILNESCARNLANDIAICKSNSGINGNRLAQAHFSLGQKIGTEISQAFPSDDAAILVLERGGRFFGDGIYTTFGGKFYPFNPKDTLPKIDSSVIIIVDSVINTGQSLLNVIKQIQKCNTQAEIIIATNVVQEKALPLLQDYKLYAVRVSTNSFTGKNQSKQIGDTGPDTADRLFNLIE